MSGEHPTILYFDETAAAPFPLILVIGREPNSDLTIANAVGRYDFRTNPRVGFWNTSYGMLAHVVGLDTRGLKQLCGERRGSPIIYADSLPRCLRNHVVDKRTHRIQITEAEVEEHIVNVFSHRQLIDRVQLVIMSGLHDDVFRYARDVIDRRCEREKIRAIHVPFFYGTNTQRIQATLTEETRTGIKFIYEGFLQSS